MASTPTNLFELTVTCRQCGSASMERIGPREYRCTHCGAITVVTQDGTKSAPEQVPPVSPGPTARPAVDYGDPTRNVLTAEQVVAVNKPGPNVFVFMTFVCVLIAAGFIGIMHACGGDNPPAGSTNGSTQPATPAVPASQLTLTPAEWSTVSGTIGGRYTALITNRSRYAVTVPVYAMSLYLRGALVETAQSAVPVATLLPGEYEPIFFAFKSPADDPHPEITAPPLADQSPVTPVRLQFIERQLIREQGKLGYRVVGVLDNPGRLPAQKIVAAAMLFDASHTLLGYGSCKVNRALRAGERTAIQIDVPTSNVNLVASYEYLLDASPATN